MASARDEELLSMDGWPLGVNNRIRETEQGQSTQHRDKPNTSLYLREAINVDLTRLGHPMRREGYSLVQGGYTHSLWSNPSLDYGLCVHEGQLCKVASNGTLTELREVHAYARVSYATVNGMVYWSNGGEMGRVDDAGTLHWGLPNPAAPVLSASAGGSLSAGKYTVSVTFVDELKEEFGASPPAEIVLQANQGLSVTIAGSWPADAQAAAVYVSQPNGEILYRATTVLGPVTVQIAANMLGRGLELETQDLRPPLPGKIVRYFSGRVYVARRDTVFFTEPLRYNLTRPAQGMYMFPSEVILLESVSDGFYVGTSEGVVFLQGTDPYNITQTNVLSHAPVPYAVTTAPGEHFGVGTESVVPVWWGVDGAMVVGLPGGEVRQLTKDRLAVPRFRTGAMLYREREGMAQVVSSLGKGGQASMMAATDSVVAEVRRNTKKLNC